jgi:hypothetical protein
MARKMEKANLMRTTKRLFALIHKTRQRDADMRCAGRPAAATLC